MFFRCSHLLLVTLIIGLVGTSAPSANQGTSTKEEMAHFLLTAEVISSSRSEIGVTRPWVLTLSDGRLTHDASFNSVDEHEALKEFRDGTFEVNFIDSYRYNLAGYRLAELLGLDSGWPSHGSPEGLRYLTARRPGDRPVTMPVIFLSH